MKMVTGLASIRGPAQVAANEAEHNRSLTVTIPLGLYKALVAVADAVANMPDEEGAPRELTTEERAAALARAKGLPFFPPAATEPSLEVLGGTPDKSRVTLPDGSCVAEGPCMHSSKIEAPPPTLPLTPGAEECYDTIVHMTSAARIEDGKWSPVGVLARTAGGAPSVEAGVARVESLGSKSKPIVQWQAQVRQGQDLLHFCEVLPMRRDAKDQATKWLKDTAMIVWARQARDYKGTCPECGKRQILTFSGAVCENGHGGAPAAPPAVMATEPLAIVESTSAPQAETAATSRMPANVPATSELLCPKCGLGQQYKQTADGWYCRNDHGPHKIPKPKEVPEQKSSDFPASVSFSVAGLTCIRAGDVGSWYEVEWPEVVEGDIIYVRRTGETAPLYFGKENKKTSVLLVAENTPGEDGVFRVTVCPARDWQAILKARKA